MSLLSWYIYWGKKYSRVISPITERFSWGGEETPAVHRSLYDRGEVSPAVHRSLYDRGEVSPATMVNYLQRWRIKGPPYILFSAGRHQGAQHCQQAPGRQQCCSYKMVLLFLTMAMDDNFLQDKTAAALATACRGLPNWPACLLPGAPPPPSATAAVLELAVSSSSTTQHSPTKLRKFAWN